MRRGLQVVVGLFGVVAVVSGLATILLGGDSVVGAPTPPPTIDSELRYYSAWYVVAGVLALRSVPLIESETTVIRILFGGLLLGGCARLLSLAAVGRPHSFFLILLGLELLTPVVVIPWQAALARRAR